MMNEIMIKMMNEIMIDGKQEFMGIDIPNVLGGFGDGKKAISDKAISEIHGIEIKHVRETINKNIKRFKTGVDLVDLKVVDQTDHNIDILESLGYTTMQISKSNNIYLLSERGYAKIIKIMDSDLAWDIHDKLISEYFDMREQLKLSVEDQAILDIVNSKSSVETAIALKSYKEIIQSPLKEEIKEQEKEIDIYSRFICDKLEVITKTELANKLDTSPQGLASVLKSIGIYTPRKCNVSAGFLNLYPNDKIIKDHISHYVNPKTGQEMETKGWIWTGRGAELVVRYLVEASLVEYCNNKGFKLKSMPKDDRVILCEDFKIE